MNNSRRAIIKKAIKLIDDAYDYIDLAAEQESESFSNIPQKLLGNQKYKKMEEYIFNLDYARNTLEEARAAVHQILE